MPDSVVTAAKVQALIDRLDAKSIDGSAVVKAMYRLDPDSLNRFLNENIPLTDAFAIAVSKLAADSLTISDNAVPLLMINRLPSDSITLSDNAVTLLEILRNPTETVSLADSPVVNLSKAIADSLTMSDSFQSAFTDERTNTDSFGFSDNASIAFGMGAFADSVSMGDSFVITTAINRSLNDNSLNARPLN